jgi:hypothetical protein
MASSMLRRLAVDTKRLEIERRKVKRAAPTSESIQKDLDGIAESVRNLQTDVEALVKRPNVLPWRQGRGTDNDPDKNRG